MRNRLVVTHYHNKQRRIIYLYLLHYLLWFHYHRCLDVNSPPFSGGPMISAIWGLRNTPLALRKIISLC